MALLVKELGSDEVTSDGEKLLLRTFELSANGVTVNLTNVGAAILKILVPNFANSESGTDNVVLAHENSVELFNSGNPTYLATIVGRVANRINKGRFSIDSKEYQLAINNGPNHLHGGEEGFSRRVWDADITSDGDGVKFTLLSRDGDQGYPGSIEVTATYSLKSLDRGAALSLHMEGRLLDDKPSPINLAQHSYFNLGGRDNARGILDHRLTMPSCAFTPTDATSIPTRDVKALDSNSVMDWRVGRRMEDALIEYGVHKAGLTYEEASRNMTLSRVSPHVAVAVATSPNPNEPYGFDHNYVVLQDEENELNWIGTLEDEKSGRRMRVFADAPGVQLYTGNWLDGSESSAFFPQWQGMCLETQAYPDSIFDVDSDLSEFANGKCFVLRPNKSVYTHRVEYLFEPTD